ncbi:MAG: substrate-binding domain-containing protein [Candidatus Electronema sp. V4]|uniref:substrate-binding domain-containing protein n=1 Tax=Candidatus Electronema sp. V4 TaxID=3454756 RepID=UPI0040559AC0
MKTNRTACLAALAAALAFTAVSAQESLAQQRETILRIHGSNTVGAQLAPDLASSFLRRLGAASVRQKEIAAGTEMDIEGDFPDQQRTKVIEIRAHGSSTAFKGLKEKQCDIGMSSRKIKSDELKDLAALGDMSGSASEHVLALDGVAVIVNSANAAVSKMSFTQLAQVFSGAVSDWSEIGWTAAPISLHARDENSGTHDTFKSLVLGDKKLAAAKRWESNDGLSDAVNADPHALGYCGLPYVKHNKALAISDGGPAVRPTVFTVATEDYPVSRRLYFYTPAVPENSHTQDFISFALGSEGQQLVRKHKFVDLTVSAEEHKVEVALGTNQNYQVLYKYLTSVRGAKRLSASFRFKGETLELDSKGQRDLDRLVDFLAQQGSKEVILAGFSDRLEDAARRIEGPVDRNYAENQALSCKRAETVKEELSSRGIKTADLLCVGSELPVASNSTEQGREKNRRVEVWMR